MKKRLFLVLAGIFIFSSFGFARDFDVGGTFLFNKPMELDEKIMGGGINIGFSHHSMNNVGFGIYNNLMFAPFDGNSIYIIDMLFGVSFIVRENDYFYIPFTIGPYMDICYAFVDGESATVNNFGFGANIAVKIKIKDNLKIFARFQGAYTFFGGGEIWLTPCIGVSF